MFAIETTELTKYYAKGRIMALDHFSLRVEQGKIFSLLGPNGAGKTTLIKLLLGIVHPTTGTAKMLGRPISDHHVHKQIGYLAENHRFPEFLNARQVLFYYGKITGVQKNILKQRIPELLAMVKLRDWAETKIRKFSKGMLQRLGIAQALINDPRLLFLDEPTDGIDPVGRREVRDLLLSLRNRGKTIFLNSHLLSEVERVSDEIAILKDGKLLRQGRVQDFISVKDQYQVKSSADEKHFRDICQRLAVRLQEQNGAFLVVVNDRQHLNRLIDEMRSHQFLIHAIIPRKISLEDYFIEVVEDREKGQ